MEHGIFNLTVSGLNWFIDMAEKDSRIAQLLWEGRNPVEMEHRIVKANPHRRVLLMESNGSGFYIKQHHPASATGRLKALVRPSRARSEWTAIRRMRAMGFQTAVPVAYAQGASGSACTSVIVTRALEGISNLKEALASLALRDKHRLAKSLGAQLRVLHDRGVYHRDMQPGNFFVKPEGDGFVFYFLDLHKAVFGRTVPERRRVRDLGQLLFNLRMFCDADTLEALFDGYTAGDPARERFVHRVRRRADAFSWLRKRSRGKRCLKNSTGFAVERRGNLRVYRRREIAAGEVISLVDRYRASGEKSQTLEGSACACHVKEVESAGFWQNLKDLFQRPRARRAWHAANALLVRGLPTPRPLALVEERRWGLLRRSYLITEHLQRASTLAAHMHDRFVMGNAGGAEIREIEGKLAETLAMLYAESIYHSDLKATNILVGIDPERVLVFHFADLDGIQLWRNPHPSRVVKNLVQLYCSVPYCIGERVPLRFFAHFLRETGLGPALRGRLPEIARRARARRERWIRIVRKYGKIL